jgi:hypothetical protein
VKISSQLIQFEMKTIKVFATLAVFVLGSVLLISGCKKDDPIPDNSTIVIPIQTTVVPAVAMGGSAEFAILAGSAITNTGATSITGDLGLSPGTSIGGFPPGVFTGTKRINDSA